MRPCYLENINNDRSESSERAYQKTTHGMTAVRKSSERVYASVIAQRVIFLFLYNYVLFTATDSCQWIVSVEGERSQDALLELVLAIISSVS